MNSRVLAIPVLAVLVSSCALNRSAQHTSSAISAITERSVRGHMAFLASDAMNGRGSGTRDEWIAASYLAAQMQQWGLEPLGDGEGFVQQIEIERSEITAPPTLAAAGKTFTHGKEMRMLALGATRVSGTLQKYEAGIPVKAGAVLLMPTVSGGAPGAKTASPPAAPGASIARASVVLTLENAGQPRPPAGARLPSAPARIVGVEAPAPAPTRIALGKDAYAIVADLPEGAVITVAAQAKQRPRTHTWNAAGRLTGSDPKASKEMILLSAHLDHIGNRPAPGAAANADTIYNGADDDASGTVAVLELARAMAMGPRPRRTVVFAFFGSEEAGGFGSRYFADKPVVPLSQLVANLQFEMIGRPDAKVPLHTLWLTGYERSTLGPALAKQGAKLVPDPHPEQSFFTRSDNIQFARRGVVAHTVSSYGLHNEYHQPSDEIGRIDFPHMIESIRSMLEPITWLANSGFKPAWLPGQKP